MDKLFTHETPYYELKNWFVDRLKKREAGDHSALPLTLDCKFCYYSNVPRTAIIYINQIDMEFEMKGKKEIKKSAIARAAKDNLFNLWEALQDQSKWNAERPTLNDLQNRYS